MKQRVNSIYITFFLILITCVVHAQQPICGFDAVMKASLQKPVMADAIQRADKTIREQLSNRNQSRANQFIIQEPTGIAYEIPLVVHIIHSGEAVGTRYNPSDVQVQNMIDFLNKVYAANTSTFAGIGNGGVNIPIRFVLARRDALCNATTGINRINASNNATYKEYGVSLPESGAKGMDDIEMKNLSRWPGSQYYNIYIVRSISSFAPSGSYTAGYAYYPGVSYSRDATVIDARVVNATGTTLAHEMGHAFGLRHTFEDSENGTCAANSNCETQGDLVCDTDPHFVTSGNCPPSTSINPCTGRPFDFILNNFMNYGNCANRFTAGQRDRALAGLMGLRRSLYVSAGLKDPLGSSVKPVQCAMPTDAANSNNKNGMGPVNISLNELQDSSFGYEDGYYIDKTCNLGTNLIASQNYTLSVATAYNPQRAKAWLDMNNNGIFETTELLLNSANSAKNYTHITSLTPAIVSAAVKNIPLRLRVAADWVNAPTFEPCTQLQYGQVEDYWVNILEDDAQVYIKNLSAKFVDGNLNVNWTAEQEINNKLFVIEISADGQKFIKVDEVLTKAANGRSAVPILYSFSKPQSRTITGAINIFSILIIIGIFLSAKNKKWVLPAILLVVMLHPLASCRKNKDMYKTATHLRLTQIDNTGKQTHSATINIVP